MIDPDFIYAPPQQPLMVLFEDSELIAIDKPAGLLSVMGRLPEHQDSAYLRILAQYPQAKVVHRLDMATSGILLFAKHRAMEVSMSKCFQAKKIQKSYIAKVQGQLTGQASIDVPMIADWAHRPKQKVDFDKGKQAKTLYQAICYEATEDSSRVQLTPVTGRSHQLRVHLAYIGHPILGDNFYHPHPKACPQQRMLLHASELAFVHPTTQQQIKITSTVPF